MRFRFPFRSLRTGLVLTYLALITASVGLLGWRIGASLNASRFAETRRDQEGRAILAASVAGDWLANYRNGFIDSAMLHSEVAALSEQISQPVDVLDVEGIVLVDSEKVGGGGDNDSHLPEVLVALNGQVGGSVRFDHDTQGDALFTVAPVTYQKQVIGIVRIELPMKLVEEANQQLWLRVIGASLLAAFATAIVSLWLASVLTRPLIQLTRAATAMAEGSLDQRVAVAGPDELQRLARAFNFMAERIAMVMGDQRAFVANAAHELRTPLTSIRLRVEALRAGAKDDPAVADQFLGDIEGETERLARLVDELLDLSRIETGLVSPRREPVAVEKIARIVVNDLTARADEASVQIEYSVPANLPGVSVDPDQIRRVFINLVDNAIKYTPRGGHIRVGLAAIPGRQSHQLGSGNWVVTTVRDDGVGIPPEDLPRVFERFYRSDKARAREVATNSGSGTGLGLAIVKSIVEAHAGKVWAESEVGKGTTFTFALPVSKVTS